MKKTYFYPAKFPGKRWRYLVWEAEAAIEDGGWFFTNRIEAAEHARLAELSTGKRYDLRDRRTTRFAQQGADNGSV